MTGNSRDDGPAQADPASGLANHGGPGDTDRDKADAGEGGRAEAPGPTAIGAPEGDAAGVAPPASRVHDRHMLEALVCPVTRAPLSYDAERQELISRAAHLAFPIRDGIPIMLVDEARKID